MCAFVFSKKYIGWVDGHDVAALVLQRSVSAQKTAGVLASVAAAMSSDSAHSSGAGVNFSHNDPLWVIPSRKRVDQVRTRAG